jgi:phosphoribosylaminoimidazolecarboxamide formyltransferase/IMP cyclohydrolase
MHIHKGLPVTEVAQMTGFPEMLDGRVKTLHPRVHGGLLARRDMPAHMAALAEHQIDTIDVLVVNLYPFEATVAKPGCTLEDAIENIDIGGPAMVRSAAKNWKDVAVLTDASQYATVIAELNASGKVSTRTKFALSVAAFNRISQYDGAISDYLSAVQVGDDVPAGDAAPTLTRFPAQFNAQYIKVQDMRYGENPHQQRQPNVQRFVHEHYLNSSKKTETAIAHKAKTIPFGMLITNGSDACGETCVKSTIGRDGAAFSSWS